MKWLSILSAILVTQFGVLFFFPELNQTPQRSDLVIVFPGEPERIAAGFKLVQAGVAPNFAISGVNLVGLEAVAKEFGPANGVQLLSSVTSRSTLVDALIMRQIVEQYHFKSVVLVTSGYHIPRSYLLSRILLAGTGVALRCYGISCASTVANGNPVLWRAEVAAKEMCKIWGSGAELAGYMATGRLLRDLPVLQKFLAWARHEKVS